ncbi:MAG: BREX-1 system phosphatase PglZ type B [Caldilinea sp.]|nr:BREX-1 system phosphatase PglZ type B [Caldilineaceae bacterium]MCW5845051.1 BREX-1 system phosphatase PglZ type B [Caldilinea sp.]
MRILDHLIRTIRSAANHNAEAQAAPACILWPDHDRQWQSAIPALQAAMPELFVLGTYDPAARTGPAIWLRCVLAGMTDELDLPPGKPPIFYLPGVSRQDLRAVESCPPAIKPLAELQYRGVIWSQVNAKDWTILALLMSKQGGLGLDVAQDNETRKAMQMALTHLLDEEVALLRGKHLDAETFNTLLTGDPIRDLLTWLDQGDGYRQAHTPEEWSAFVALCKTHLAFDPANEGELAGAAKLAAGAGPWRAVWERYCEAPRRYPRVPALLRRCAMPPAELFSDTVTHGGWPQWNEEQEGHLRHALQSLATVPAHVARERIADLERQHGARRHLVWAVLCEAPLASALEHLAVTAEVTQNALAAGSTQEVAAAYVTSGWRADDALLRALAAVSLPDDVAVVTVALRVVYLPWAEQAARYLQQQVARTTYPGGTLDSAPALPYAKGDCVLFVDGLRLDVARRLADRLSGLGYTVEEALHWAALPSVTATAKPAVTPVRKQIAGGDASADFQPQVAESGQPLQGGQPLKKLLGDAGWPVLDGTDTGNGTGQAWCEIGNIDREGHDRGVKLARHLDELLEEIELRVCQLLIAGWQRVQIVTDHGWLLFPGGLPKHDLHAVLTENKWGRCAAIKPGAAFDGRLFPWFWNPSQHFALADGVSCFRAGMEYAHGGLSLQECVTARLTVTAKGSAAGATATIAGVVWKQQRCIVTIDGGTENLSADIRTQPGNPASSIAASKPFRLDGTASLLVENEDLAGHAAVVVVLDESGTLLAQMATVVGGTE